MNAALARPWRSGQYMNGGNGGMNGGDPWAELAALSPDQQRQLVEYARAMGQCEPICAWPPPCPTDPREVLKHRGMRKEGCPPMYNNWNCGPQGYPQQYQGYHQKGQGYGSPWCPGAEPCQDKILGSVETLVAPGATVAFSISTPEAFKPERIYVVSSLAQYFRFNSFQIGSELIFLNPVYADVLNEASNDIRMNLPTMTAGVTASGTITNIDTVAAHPIIVSLLGQSLCY